MSQCFGYPEFTKDGIKKLTDETGEYRDMMMDISVYKLQAGETRCFFTQEQETAILLIQGEVRYEWQKQVKTAERSSFFTQGAYCLHACKAVRMVVTALRESEILVQRAKNDTLFDAKFYTPIDAAEDTFGANQYGGKAIRTVRTLFDDTTAPYSNLVMGELLTPHGGWSSYIPHHHPQPEVYYYRFDKPQGFGACFIGDEVYKVKDGSFCAIPGGKTHPQVTAPGYQMYYVWMIRNFENDPWKDRIWDPDHEWLLTAKL